MFFFLNWGSKWKYNVKEGGVRVEKFCPECTTRGIFFEVVPTKYFSIFWIPVAPTESKKPLLECPNCHERFYIQQSDYLSAIKDIAKPKINADRAIHLSNGHDFCIVPCDYCGKRLKVPNNNKMLRVTCPLCKNTFNFQKGEKILEATPIDSYIKPNIAWWKKNLYFLIGGAVLLGIAILFLALPEYKPQVEAPFVAPPAPTQTSIPSAPKVTDLKPPTEKPQTNVDKAIEDNPKKIYAIEPIEPKNPKRLPLGSSPFGRGIFSGHSTLTVDNGTGNDAIVKVIRFMDREQKVRNFYIHNGSKWTEKRLPPGQYVIRVAFGRDWNSKSRKFNFHRSFNETEVFQLTETTSVRETDEGQLNETHFKKMSITLHKVPLGNFKSHEIIEEDFDR